MTRPVTIAAADKNVLVLSGLEKLLAEHERFEFVAGVQSGAEFLELCRTTDFDIGITGWVLPDMTGQAILETLNEWEIRKRIIVFSGTSASDVPRRVMKLGGYAFCSKTDNPKRLCETINTVAAGNMSFPFFDVRALYDDPLDRLTLRERELLAALAGGWTNLQIASRFGISHNTVKFHLKNLYDKLQVKNRAMAAALYASLSKADD
jgi:two-component system nitrate/nitrite response regulator NarP